MRFCLFLSLDCPTLTRLLSCRICGMHENIVRIQCQFRDYQLPKSDCSARGCCSWTFDSFGRAVGKRCARISVSLWLLLLLLLLLLLFLLLTFPSDQVLCPMSWTFTVELPCTTPLFRVLPSGVPCVCLLSVGYCPLEWPLALFCFYLGSLSRTLCLSFALSFLLSSALSLSLPLRLLASSRLFVGTAR